MWALISNYISHERNRITYPWPDLRYANEKRPQQDVAFEAMICLPVWTTGAYLQFGRNVMENEMSIYEYTSSAEIL